MHRQRVLSIATAAALFSSAAVVHASDLSGYIKASADLCLSLADTPAEDRIAAAAAHGYIQQLAPFAAFRAWYEAPISPGEMTPDQMEKRWKRAAREFELTGDYDASVLFATTKNDDLLLFTHPEFTPPKGDPTRFLCTVRGYDWFTQPELEAALATAGYTQSSEELLTVSEPHVTSITRVLPDGDDRDTIIVVSYRNALAQYETSRAIQAVTIIRYQPVPTS